MDKDDNQNKHAIVDLELTHNAKSFGKIQIQIEDIKLEENHDKVKSNAHQQKQIQIVSFNEEKISVNKVVNQNSKIGIKIFQWINDRPSKIIKSTIHF